MYVIKSKQEIESIFKNGRWYNHPFINVLVNQSDTQRDPLGRVAFIAGKKTGMAYQRNRSKRMLRQAAFETGLPIPGYDIILVATPKTKEVSLEKLHEALEKVLLRAHIKNEKHR
ncbi:MAG: ribonuclease P protein component [Coriobacteriia bacterium]|nr:ribonuclease P protein component [Coriobacteriia bacterium]